MLELVLHQNLCVISASDNGRLKHGGDSAGGGVVQNWLLLAVREPGCRLNALLQVHSDAPKSKTIHAEY